MTLRPERSSAPTKAGDPQYDQNKTTTNGKIFTLTCDRTGDQVVNVDDLEWHYLTGNGDFRSNEVKKLRDDSNIIVTNPPFSLFRDFLAWIIEAQKQFVIIGNKNCVTYKEVFPLFKDNKMWSGRTEWSGGMWFETKNQADVDKVIDGINMKNIASVWFTNLDHGRRHQPLPLMTMADNLKFSKHKEIKGKQSYDRYDNYDAIEVPYTDSIPSDYEGVMGVPISFLDKYNPDQFEILGSDAYDESPPTKRYSSKEKVVDGKKMKSNTGTMGCVIREANFGSGTYFDVGYPVKAVYKRIFIRHRMETTK